MRPIVIAVAGPRSSNAADIVKNLNRAGAEAYYGYVGGLRNPLVVNWSTGGSKYRELQTLAMAGVPVPRYGLACPPGEHWLPRRQHHAEAKDFTSPPAVGDFYTEPTFTNHEFRVHVIHDYAFRTQYKSLPEGARALVVKGIPVRNHSLGWRFDPRPDVRFPETTLRVVRDAARAAVRALGYDMGAVDVGLIVGSNGLVPDRPLVFEVNTRPSMDEYTQAAYVEALLKLAS